MSISLIDLKILWAKSGGLCAFPGCHQELICKTTKDIIGHACHIIAHSPNGPRGNANATEDEINSESNLILLCPTHHRIIDTDVKTYTAHKLTEMKTLHELNIYEKIHTGSKWNLNFTQLYYINLPRISIIAAFSGIQMEFDFMERFRCLHQIGFQLNSVMLKIKDTMHHMAIQSVLLPDDLSELKIGQTIEFTEKFRTKNMPSPSIVCKSNYSLNGTLTDDPHIFITKNGKKLILTLDPTWMTTSTSFSDFSKGYVDVAGLAAVKQVKSTEIIASPYILGTPKHSWDDIWSSNPPRSIELL